LQLVKHHDIVISVLPKQALEANRAEIVLTESFDVFVPMNLALCEILVPVGNDLLLLWLHWLASAKLQIHFIVGIVGHMRRRDILGVSFNANSSATIDASNWWSTTTSTSASSSSGTTSPSATGVLRAVAHSTSDLIIVVTLHF
jgi:hypothetical protein